MKKSLFLLSLLWFLASCALSPEEQAARQAEQEKAQRLLEIQLAGQCNPEVAETMRSLDAARKAQNDEEVQRLSEVFQQQVSEPLFHNCYRIAWENYLAQRKLAQIEQHERLHYSLYMSNSWHWHPPYYYHRPYFRPPAPPPRPPRPPRPPVKK